MDYLSFTLPDDFVNEYANKTVNWGYPIGGGNYLGELVFYDKYSRLKDDGTKERWHEVCRRVIEGMFSILRDHVDHNRTYWNQAKALGSAKEAYDRMFNMKWLPPGRGLWAMGSRPVNEERNSAMLYNCFAGTEKFLTKEYGSVSFADVFGEVVHVVGKDGNWQKAEVQTFGFQPVQRIVFAPARQTGARYRSNHRVEITATPNHRWILSDGSETTTLSVGDTVPSGRKVVPLTEEEMSTYREGMIHGLIFGDGVKITHAYANGDYGFKLRVCDDRVKNLLDNDPKLMAGFDRVSYDYKWVDGDPVCLKRSSHDLKDFPVNQTSSYLVGFLQGWIQADANKQGDTWKLASQNPKAHEWLKDNAALAGYVLVGANIDSVTETNFGPRSAPCWRFSLRTDCLWRVESILPLDEDVQVYCAVVPDEAAFTLSGGIYTGNCAFLSLDGIGRSIYDAIMPFMRAFEMSMNGIGVGISLVDMGKVTIHQPKDEVDTFVIPDTREGWTEALGALLESYFAKNRNRIEFDYSLIRPKGSPLKRFGGTASGPDPLRVALNKIGEILDGRDGERLVPSDAVDIINLVGKATQAGGARRSALLMLGEKEDKAFLDLKNKKAYPERNGEDGWGWTSNNSVSLEVGDDIDFLIDRIADNGEPGLIWLDVTRNYGRLSDGFKGDDLDVKGFNPCAEAQLEHAEVCNLSETFPLKHETRADFIKTIKYAYLYNKAVSLLPTPWPETNEVIARNRRIGLSMSGLAEYIEKKDWHSLRRMMDESYGEILRLDDKYSRWLGVRESIRHTVIKPSGTVSLLAFATPGVHWPVYRNYIRRMRVRNDAPLAEVARNAGYHVEPALEDPQNSLCIEFPVMGQDIRTEEEVSIWEKASFAAFAQEWFADQSVSCTITFKPEEAEQIPVIIKAFEGKVKTLSFLPLSEEGAYQQMPYEGISEENYDVLVDGVSPLDWDTLYQGDGLEDAVGEAGCTTDRCEVKFA